jgi:hypothetical protein
MALVGRASLVASFSVALDAISFGLALQEALVRAEWPAELLEHPLCARVSRDDGDELRAAPLFCGLRVSVGLSHGKDVVLTDRASDRAEVSGEPIELASDLAWWGCPGQVLCTSEFAAPKSGGIGADLFIEEDLGLQRLGAGHREHRVLSLLSENLAARVFGRGGCVATESVVAKFNLTSADTAVSGSARPLGSATIVALTVPGLGDLWRREAAALCSDLARATAIVRAAAAQHSGYLVRSHAESHLYAFSDPHAALRFALNVQDELVAVDDWSAELRQHPSFCVVRSTKREVLFRGPAFQMGVDFGLVREHGPSGLDGRAILVAEKVCNAASAGQVLVTSQAAQAYAAMGSHGLQRDFATVSLGPHRFAELGPQPVELVQVSSWALAGRAFPPLASLSRDMEEFDSLVLATRETLRPLHGGPALSRDLARLPDGDIGLSRFQVSDPYHLWSSAPRHLAMAVLNVAFAAVAAAAEHCRALEVSVSGTHAEYAFERVADAVLFSVLASRALMDAPWPAEYLAGEGAPALGPGGTPLFVGLPMSGAVVCGSPVRGRTRGGQVRLSGPLLGQLAGLADLAQPWQVLVTSEARAASQAVTTCLMRDLGRHEVPLGTLAAPWEVAACTSSSAPAPCP